MKKALTLVLIAALFSCHRSQSDFEGGEAEEKVVESNLILPPSQTGADKYKSAPVGSRATKDSFSRKIIKSGEISFNSDNINLTRKTIVQVTKINKGYIAYENEADVDNTQKEYSLTIKVPAENFDRLLQQITSTAAKIISKNIRAEDVTSTYYDQEARLKSKKELENRYLQLLGKATAISDMIKIENKLAEIRGDIESLEAEFLLLQQEVAFSSLKITYYSQPVQVESNTFILSLKEAFADGGNRATAIFLFFISYWPLIILLVAGFILYRTRKIRKLKADSSE